MTMCRVIAPAKTGHHKPASSSVGSHECAECGTPCATSKTFCSPSCRLDFNNRRRTRGASLYDLFMAMRFDRQAAKDAKAWQAMCTLASAWAEEDKADRGGRKSFVNPKDVIARTPWVHALTCLSGKAHRTTKAK
jgi:predicted nucleic acid-binding Zn ribbon protein